MQFHCLELNPKLPNVCVVSSTHIQYESSQNRHSVSVKGQGLSMWFSELIDLIMGCCSLQLKHKAKHFLTSVAVIPVILVHKLSTIKLLLLLYYYY